ncbi:hypothetical protein QVD17_22206, partial [Tagetes erecta]
WDASVRYRMVPQIILFWHVRLVRRYMKERISGLKNSSSKTKRSEKSIYLCWRFLPTPAPQRLGTPELLLS